MAVMLNPDSLTFILTSVTSSEIISTTLDKSPGFSSLTSILIIGAEPQHQKTGSAFKYCYHEVYLYLSTDFILYNYINVLPLNLPWKKTCPKTRWKTAQRTANWLGSYLGYRQQIP